MLVAFLRGMNLGRRRITNAELAEVFVGLGLARVSTYRASGNVLFADEPREGLCRRIEEGLEASLGYQVRTFVRSDEELAAIVALEPFAAELVAERGKVQVTLLSEPPGPETRVAVLAHQTEDDRLAFGPRELHWLPRGRTTDSQLDSRAVERLLGPGTTRTLGTLANIARRL